MKSSSLAGSRGLRAALMLCCAAGILATGVVRAQSAGVPPAPADQTSADRAKRDADKVFQWILLQSDKPRKTRDSSAAKGQGNASASASTNSNSSTTASAAPAAPKAAAPVRSEPTVAARDTSAPKPALATVTAAPSSTLAAAAATVAPAIPTPSTATLAAAASAPEDDDVDEPLVVVKQVQPEFGLNNLRTLRKGTVQVRFVVQPDGSVDEVGVMKTTSARLNAAAIAAMSQWKFKPIHHAQDAAIELGFNID